MLAQMNFNKCCRLCGDFAAEDEEAASSMHGSIC